MVALRHAASGLGRCAAITTVAALSALTLLSAPCPAQAQGYDLSIIARTGDTIAGRTVTNVFSPSLNNNGTVAFPGSFSGGGGIFTQNALLAQTGDTIGGRTLTGVGGLSLNDSGTVAFAGQISPGGSGSIQSGIFTPNTLLVQRGDIIGGRTLDFVAGVPSLNNSDTVAFFGQFSGGPGGGGFGIFTRDALLVRQGDTIAGRRLTSVGNYSLNNNGTVAFAGSFSSGPGSTQPGIFTQNAFLVQNGDIIGGRTITGLNSITRPSFNNNGTAAFAGRFLGSGSGIFTQNALLIQSGDTIGGRTLTGVSLLTPSLNDNGTVASFGSFSGGGGLFTQNALVAQTGATIGGRTLTGFDLVGGPSLNNNGQIAFLGQFSDFSSAIILATPRADVIPEPGTLALLASSLSLSVGLGVARRRRC